jgi:tetratricopeptide (TPR) repeat protein
MKLYFVIVLALLLSLTSNLFSQTAQEFVKMGNDQVDLGNNDEALSFYKKALKVDPKYASAYFDIGLVYDSKKQTDNAIQSFKQCLKYKADEVDALTMLGFCYAKKKQSAKALKYYEEAIKLDPKNGFAYYNAGVILYAKPETKEAGYAYIDRSARLGFSDAAKAMIDIISPTQGSFVRRLNYDMRNPSSEAISAFFHLAYSEDGSGFTDIMKRRAIGLSDHRNLSAIVKHAKNMYGTKLSVQALSSVLPSLEFEECEHLIGISQTELEELSIKYEAYFKAEDNSSHY